MAVTDLAQRYAEIVGEERVLTHPEALAEYTQDMTENEAGRADLVVKPTSAEQVQRIVQLAAEDGTPVTPVCTRMNVGGLAIPSEGGVVVDLTGMDQIIELDRDHMYALIEPGVSWAQITEYLKKEAPELTISYPLAPPHTSVVANFLMDGLGNLSLLHGAAGEQIAGAGGGAARRHHRPHRRRRDLGPLVLALAAARRHRPVRELPGHHRHRHEDGGAALADAAAGAPPVRVQPSGSRARGTWCATSPAARSAATCPASPGPPPRCCSACRARS